MWGLPKKWNECTSFSYPYDVFCHLLQDEKNYSITSVANMIILWIQLVNNYSYFGNDGNYLFKRNPISFMHYLAISYPVICFICV